MMKLFQMLNAKHHLERLERSEGASKSSALLLTILIAGLIAIVSLSVSRLSISEIKMAGGANESAAAYFAAEAGLEDGLARWRWDRNVEVPVGATETSGSIRRCNISTTQCAEGNPPSITVGPEDKYYDLKIWYKADKATGELKKDESREFFIPDGSTPLTLSWAGVKNVASGTAYISWEIIAMKNSGGMATFAEGKNGRLLTFATSDSGSHAQTINLSGDLTGYILRIKPWIGSNNNGTDENGVSGYAAGQAPTAVSGTELAIEYTLTPSSTPSSSNININIDSGFHYIESTGYYKNTKRKLVAKIDRKSGTILSVYDFVIYAGSTLTNQ
jgi:hypothetical protein